MQSIECRESSQIVIQKDREEQRYQNIWLEQKNARNYFFTQQIKSQLKAIGAQEKEQSLITQFFIEQTQKMNGKLAINFAQLRKIKLKIYQSEIYKLQQTYNSIESHYKRRQKECMPILYIIKHKCQSLKVIKIQYQQIIDQARCIAPPYCISAFELFSVVHNNKLLTQVTLKGIEVSQFQQFIKILNQKNKEQTIETQDQRLNWIMNFSPSKSLKLSISAQLLFDIQQKQTTFSQISNLMFFLDLFQRVSDIKAKILIGKWSQFDERQDTVQCLWRCLKYLKSIHISVDLSKYYSVISAEKASFVRSMLFDALSCFTEIVRLQFSQFKFNTNVGVNDFLAIEQSLATLFRSNLVTHLRINYCQRFPILPQIPSLKSMSFQGGSFRKDSVFMDKLAESKSIQTIICSYVPQQCIISQSFANNLENLLINGCMKIKIGQLTSETPLNIKRLQISKTNLCYQDDLPQLFSRFYHITCLSLREIDFEHQTICRIPSPRLAVLRIRSNNVITDVGLQAIDLKWPQLRQLLVKQCKRVVGNAWKTCSFKGLIELTVNQKELAISRRLHELKRKGTKVNC